MTPSTFLRIAVEPAMSLLPIGMDTPAARGMVIAICLQESRLTHRRQARGPARGFPQFELAGGIVGVLTHPETKPIIEPILEQLCYVPAASACHTAIEHNDVLAVIFARLLLWTVHGALPGRDNPDEGWRQYVDGWRPGRPHRDSWNALYAQAWDAVEGRRR